MTASSINPVSRDGRKPPQVEATPVGLLGLVLGAFIAVSGFLGASGALAQDPQVQTLIDRIDRLQRELVTLQRSVYRGEEPPAPAAAAPVGGDVTQTQAARLELKLSQFNAELRSLTGQVEELTFAVDAVNQRLDKLVADVDFRLQRLEGGSGSASSGQLSNAQTGSASMAAGGQQSSGPSFDEEPKTLGTISEGDLKALQAEQVDTASPAQGEEQVAAAMSGNYQLPGETSQEQYNYAFGLLRQANYGEAELALRAFVDSHADDPLAGNAKYWLGETFYVRGDYQQAAVTFAEAYQEYPDNSKAPDNLLKLGMSLAALGSTADACGTLDELSRRYPDAPPTVLKRGAQERSKLGCQ